jgi:cytochrome c-type biogenesis protein CcmH/NrfG
MAYHQRVGIVRAPASRTRVRSWPQADVSEWYLTALVVLCAVVAALLCLLYVWQGAKILDLTARREGARDVAVARREENRLLETKLAEALSLPIVSRIARETLGMVEVDPRNVRYVAVPADLDAD